MAVLENFVKLRANVPKTLIMRNPRIEERTVTDPRTKAPKTVRAWVADVEQEDNVPVKKIFSTLSEKLASQLQSLHENGLLVGRRVTIVWRPAGYATEYEVRA
jgi:hypothetical protein